MTTYVLNGLTITDLESGAYVSSALRMVLPDWVRSFRYAVEGSVGDIAALNIDFLGTNGVLDDAWFSGIGMGYTQFFGAGSRWVGGITTTLTGETTVTDSLLIVETTDGGPLLPGPSNLAGISIFQIAGEDHDPRDLLDGGLFGNSGLDGILGYREPTGSYVLRDMPGVEVTEDDVVATRPGLNRIDGGKGDDLLTSARGAATLEGGSGQDTLDTVRGDTVLRGGKGNDRIDAGSGTDKLFGESGADHLTGGGGRDSLDGGTGNDLLAGEQGADILQGGKGKDTLSGGSKADKLNGGIGSDAMDGGSGADTLNGNGGGDSLEGGKGADVIDGGSGRDWIKGGGGDDSITTGPGADVIVFGRSHGDDFVSDFRDDRDELHLSGKLWRGDLSARQVVNRFGVEEDDLVRLDFGRKGSVTLDGIGEVSALIDDIVIV